MKSTFSSGGLAPMLIAVALMAVPPFVAADEGDPRGQVMAMVGLAFTCYQTGQFDKAGEIAFPPEVEFPVGGILGTQTMRQFSSWTIDFDSMTYIFEE